LDRVHALVSQKSPLVFDRLLELKLHYQLMGKRIWVAGHRGMVGATLTRKLGALDCELIAVDRATLDLTDQKAVRDFYARKKIDCVIVAAAKVGGILGNDTYPADFLYDNLAIELNLIEGAHAAGINRLLFLGSSCIYPRLAEQPIREDSLLSGPLEPTNQWYSMAKIAGIKLCDAYRRQHGRRYISAMPTNLYGPGDNFDLQNSHVIPAMIRKFHAAKVANRPEVDIWGSGKPLREFMHVDDLADALVFLLQNFDDMGPINVGSGEEISIADLAQLIADVIGFKGELVYDHSKPDGTPRKLLDSTRLRSLGWESRIGLRDGLESTYQWYISNFDREKFRADRIVADS
jgi:GDP-L-fucose synthase